MRKVFGIIFIILVLCLVVYLILVFVPPANGEEASKGESETDVFSKMILRVISKNEPLTPQETQEILDGLAIRWSTDSGYGKWQDKTRAIMALENDKKKLEILLLWLQVISQEREKEMLLEIKSIKGSENVNLTTILAAIKGSQQSVIAALGVWGSSLLQEKNSQIAQLKGEIASKEVIFSNKLAEELRQKKELESKLKAMEDRPITKGGVDQAEFDKLKAENEGLIKKVAELEDKLRQQPEVAPVWPKKEKGPGNFWVGVGAIGMQKVYTNPFGFVADSAVFHTRPWLPIYFETGARKFLIRNNLAIQLFGGIGSTWFLGTGLVGYVKFLDLSFSGGIQYVPDYLIGDLAPIQFFGELTHEGRWTRMGLRFVPQLSLVQLSGGVKF